MSALGSYTSVISHMLPCDNDIDEWISSVSPAFVACAGPRRDHGGNTTRYHKMTLMATIPQDGLMDGWMSLNVAFEVKSGGEGK